MKHHLAILSPGWIDLILEGKKTIESRFTKVKCPPFGKVHEGDVVFLKESGGLVKGACLVGKVETFENLTLGQKCDLFYSRSIVSRLLHPQGRGDGLTTVPEDWWEAKHATLIHIAEVNEFHSPFAVKKRDPRAWLVYDHITDFTKTFVDENLRMSVEDIYSPNSEIISFLES